MNILGQRFIAPLGLNIAFKIKGYDAVTDTYRLYYEVDVFGTYEYVVWPRLDVESAIKDGTFARYA